MKSTEENKKRNRPPRRKHQDKQAEKEKNERGDDAGEQPDGDSFTPSDPVPAERDDARLKW